MPPYIYVKIDISILKIFNRIQKLLFELKKNYLNFLQKYMN